MIRRLLIIILFIFLALLPCEANQHYNSGVLSGASGATLVFEDGFESPWSPTSNTGNWSNFNNTPTSEGTIVKKGSVSMETDAIEYMDVDYGSGYTEVWFDFWFYVDNGAWHNIQIWYGDNDGNTKALYVIVDGTEGVAIKDDTTTWDAGLTLSGSTWYHAFFHVEMGAGDGSETMQIAINEADNWDAWDYSSTSETIDCDNIDSTDYGLRTNPQSYKLYFDTFRFYQGSGIPSDWQ